MPPVLLPALALAVLTMATKVLTGYIAAPPGRHRACPAGSAPGWP